MDIIMGIKVIRVMIVLIIIFFKHAPKNELIQRIKELNLKLDFHSVI